MFSARFVQPVRLCRAGDTTLPNLLLKVCSTFACAPTAFGPSPESRPYLLSPDLSRSCAGRRRSRLALSGRRSLHNMSYSPTDSRLHTTCPCVSFTQVHSLFALCNLSNHPHHHTRTDCILPRQGDADGTSAGRVFSAGTWLCYPATAFGGAAARHSRSDSVRHVNQTSHISSLLTVTQFVLCSQLLYSPHTGSLRYSPAAT